MVSRSPGVGAMLDACGLNPAIQFCDGESREYRSPPTPSKVPRPVRDPPRPSGEGKFWGAAGRSPRAAHALGYRSVHGITLNRYWMNWSV